MQVQVVRAPMVWLALAVALVLAGVTGFVDSLAYLRLLGVFPANQSGNAIFLGTAIGGASGANGWQSGTSMAGFAAGVLVGELMRRHVVRRRVGPWLLLVEVVLLGTVLAIAGPVDSAHPIGGAEGYVLIVLASMAMGVQTTVIRHVAGIAVATTYQTGAIAHMSEALSRVMTRGARWHEERELIVLVLVLVCYVGGAALGAGAPGQWRWSIALAAGVVALIALVWWSIPRAFLGSGEL
jgi:uncharacterized membrane protein YoaK (UPF0700 family)